MKLKIRKQVYQWIEDGEHRIGRIINSVYIRGYPKCRLVQRYHTGELHIVRASELTPYHVESRPPADRTQQIVDAGGPTH